MHVLWQQHVVNKCLLLRKDDTWLSLSNQLVV